MKIPGKTGMKILTPLLLLATWASGASAAQAPAPAPVPAPSATPAPAPGAASPANPPRVMHFNPGTLIRVKLETAIDVKKAHAGDPVLASTTDDLNSNPPGLATRGCKVTGHIVEVTPREKDTPAKLRIVFDKMTLTNGTDMALPAAIQAVGFADSQGGPAPVPASGGSPGSYVGQKMSTPGSPSGNADAKLPFNAQGAVGMSGVSLNTGTAQDSILTSEKHNIKLESGMQMILRTN